MTKNRRILVNVVATYGRSLYALALGLFTARWALMALGLVLLSSHPVLFSFGLVVA